MSAATLKRNIAELGLLNGLLYLTGRAMQKISGGRLGIIRYLLVAQPVPPSPGKLRSSPSAVVRRVEADDPIVQAFPRPVAVIQKRFADGAICFVAESAGRFAGFLWLARNAYDEDEVRCRYELAAPTLCAWDYDVYVEPEFRIGRTFARLWQAANQHLADEGVRWSISRISSFNPTSLAAHGRLGIQTQFSATFVCVGPVQITFAGVAPYLHLSFGPGRQPTFRISLPREAR